MNKNTELELNTTNDKLVEALSAIFNRENFPKFTNSNCKTIANAFKEQLKTPIFDITKAIGNIAKLQIEFNQLKKNNEKLQVDFEALERFKEGIYTKIFGSFALSIVAMLIIKYLL